MSYRNLLWKSVAKEVKETEQQKAIRELEESIEEMKTKLETLKATINE